MRTRILIAAALFLALCPISRASQGTKLDLPLEITSKLETESRTVAPTLARGVFTVDAYGGMATVRLAQHFTNKNEADLEVRFATVLGGDLQLYGFHLESAGLRELFAEPVKGKPTATFRTEPFTIEPGETAVVQTTFNLSLPFEENRFRLKLPALSSGPTAGKTRPPVSAEITVHHSEPLRDAQSETHPILVDFFGDRSIVEPVEREITGDKPFELTFALGTPEDPTLAGYVRGKRKDGARAVEAFFSPPETPAEVDIRPKQVVYVVDTSGSMTREDKLEQANRAVSTCLDSLREDDRFNILDFDSEMALLSPAPLESTELNRDMARDWLRGRKADGGTKLLPALALALQGSDPDRHRMVVLVTDGMIEDEAGVISLIDEELDDARLFVVGTGSHARQETLLRLAERGRGAATFFGRASELEEAVTEMFRSIADPLAWDLELDLEGAEVQEILPRQVPDLYAQRPVRVLAWVRGDVPDRLRLRMSTVDGSRELEVKLPPSGR